MPNQFFTFCKRCGKQILMTQNIETHRWTPCDPTLITFAETTEGAMTYVTPQGEVKHGRPDIGEQCEIGYLKHRRDCKK